MLKIFSSSSDALFENPRHCFLSQYVTREKQFFVLVTPVLADSFIDFSQMRVWCVYKLLQYIHS